MADADTMSTNGCTTAPHADTRPSAAAMPASADAMRPSGKTVPTLVDRRMLAAVEEEMARRGWEGSRVGFLSELLDFGLECSRRLQPVSRTDKLSAIFRNGAK